MGPVGHLCSVAAISRLVGQHAGKEASEPPLMQHIHTSAITKGCMWRFGGEHRRRADLVKFIITSRVRV